ncbi:MAG: CpsD/CapB family tyrosine-protein kinase [Coriobacteriia bacterium]|nr:CpsD/CapB family tyrosine-protein kinase [Coriobacteriia bacterium]
MAKKNRKVLGKFEVPGLRNASKTLLANIRFASLEEEVKTICITSTRMDEGKSTVCSNLACAIASSGKRVLVVDADMRRRSLGGMLDVHGSTGMYSVLSGKSSLDKAIIETPIKNLYFLDSEPHVPNPPDILSTKRFSALLETLRQMFDYVIIDTPPTGLFVDASIVANQVDGTLLALRQHGAPRKDVINAVTQLKAGNAHILGTVMTFVPTNESSSYYYSYYYSEEGKGPEGEEDAMDVVPTELVADDISEWADDTGLADAVSVDSFGVGVPRTKKKDNPFAPGAFKSDDSAKRGRHSHDTSE